MYEITVQASPLARKAFEVSDDANVRTGDVVRIARIIPSALQLLALIESARVERVAGHAALIVGNLTLLAQIEGDELREPPSRLSRFVGEAEVAPESIAKRFFGTFPAEEDPVTKTLFTPAALHVGSLLTNASVDVAFNAAGFNRHTAVLAQSGSGKSYALGVMLEELLSKTSVRIVVVDPNGDFGAMILSLGGKNISIRGPRLQGGGTYVAASGDPMVYERATEFVLRGARCVLFDLSHLDVRLWMSVLLPLLHGLWQGRQARLPTCVVADEAHHFAPEGQELGLDSPLGHLLRIAAEGRKYGLWLTVASQRPQKLNSNVISQCDNLILMKLSSQYDLVHVGEAFSAASQEMVDLARGFKKGWALAIGKIVRAPTLLKFRKRSTPEGGGDVSLAWARASA
jgi:DNA helicase HerA-like ATPase